MENIKRLEIELATAKLMMGNNFEAFKGGWMGNQYLYWKAKVESLERQIKKLKKKQ